MADPLRLKIPATLFQGHDITHPPPGSTASIEQGHNVFPISSGQTLTLPHGQMVNSICIKHDEHGNLYLELGE